MGFPEVNTVYVLGAGASHGDTLNEAAPDAAYSPITARPPLANGFFSESLFNGMGQSARSFETYLNEAIPYIRLHWGIEDEFGSGAWTQLSLEQVLSHIEQELEFIAPESSNWIARLQIKIQLISHIYRVIGMCTAGKFGDFSRTLVKNLNREDSVISFNWDLLVDSELLAGAAVGPRDGDVQRQQYWHFLGCLETYPPGDPQPEFPWQNGLFLKPHGSLNWFRCSNPACPTVRSFVFNHDVQECLSWSVSPQWATCANCGAKTSPLIVPPIARKRITEDPVIRNVWGLARRKLQFAKKLVVIGFSFAPGDFFAEWLLRSSTTHLNLESIFVVDPSNNPTSEYHGAFRDRLNQIFPRDFNSKFCHFSQIEEVIARLQKELST